MGSTHPGPGSARWLRHFKALCLLLAALAVTVAEAAGESYRVYVGTYTGNGSEGIYSYAFDPSTGASTGITLAAKTDNPSFLAVGPDGRYLYAVNELDSFQGQPTGAVSVFATDRGSGRLTPLQQVPSLGQGPAFVSLDQAGRFVLVANYNSGNYAVFPVGPDGRLGPRSAFEQDVGSSVNPVRQAGPHAHSIQTTGDNRFVIVADLGLDHLPVYRFDADTGTLTPGNPRFATVDPGSGPRHVAFAPSGRFVYVVSEMASTITVFAYDAGPGTLHPRQTVSTLPESYAGKNKAAEIAMDAQGKFLYVSNRGDDSIVVFGVDPDDGSVRPLQRVPSGGRTPRHFAIDPTGQWLIAANEDSNNIRFFQVDPRSGRLTPTDRSLNVVSPVCVRIVPRQ